MIVGIEQHNSDVSISGTMESVSYVGNPVRSQTLHENTWSVSLMVVPRMMTISSWPTKLATKMQIPTQPFTIEITPVKVLNTKRVGKR